ncbi:MAG: hypothetical protein AAGA99_00665 [Actinomycetota bacterium]
MTSMGTGVQVNDATASNILTGATLNSAGTTQSTGVDLQWPRTVRFQLDTATVTGTSPTLDVTVQASSVSDFSSDVVDLGSFSQVTASSTSRDLQVYVPRQYVRAAVTVGGTSPVFTGSTLVAEDPFTRLATADTA